MKEYVNQLFDVTDKVAVITGASRGLGKGYALHLAKAGAKAICVGRTEADLQATVKEIEAGGGCAGYQVMDVSDPLDIEKGMKEIFENLGSIDILVNNAGTEIAEPFDQVTPEHFDHIMNVNMKGTYFVAREAVKYMKQRGKGKVINIASLGSYIGLAESTVYCATKGAVVQFTKALSIELAKENIQVNAIAPGYFLTEMTQPFFEDEEHRTWIENRIPVGRVGVEEDLAGTALFLASRASDYITGQTIIVDGGWLAS